MCLSKQLQIGGIAENLSKEFQKVPGKKIVTDSFF